MGTTRWTSISERGFECLQPVRLIVSLSHRRRSLMCVVGLVAFLGAFLFWFCGSCCFCFPGMRSSSFDRSRVKLSWRVRQWIKKKSK